MDLVNVWYGGDLSVWDRTTVKEDHMENVKRWYFKNQEFDDELRERFEHLLDSEHEPSLGSVILYD